MYLVFIVGARHLMGPARIIAAMDIDILFILFTATTWTESSVFHLLGCHPFLAIDTVRRFHVTVEGWDCTWGWV